MKKCPFCAEQIKDEAVVCRYCGRDLPVQTNGNEISQKKHKRSIWALGAILAIIFTLFATISSLWRLHGNELFESLIFGIPANLVFWFLFCSFSIWIWRRTERSTLKRVIFISCTCLLLGILYLFVLTINYRSQFTYFSATNTSVSHVTNRTLDPYSGRCIEDSFMNMNLGCARSNGNVKITGWIQNLCTLPVENVVLSGELCPESKYCSKGEGTIFSEPISYRYITIPYLSKSFSPTEFVINIPDPGGNFYCWVDLIGYEEQK